MPIFDATAFTNMLKIVYGDQAISQVNDKVVLRKTIGTSRDEWQGLQVQFPVPMGRAQSFMAHGPLGLLPTPQDETIQPTIIPVKWIHGRCQIGIDAIMQSMSNKGSFARANDFLMKRLVANLTDELNRMMTGTGRGILALVDDTASVGSAADPLLVDAPGGIASDVFGSRYLQSNMLIGFTDGTTLKGVRKITSIVNETSATPGLVLDQTVAAGTDYAENDFIVRAANASITNLTRDTSLDNEPMGLEGIVDDGTLVATFQSIARATYTDWQASLLAVSALSLDALQRLYDTIDQQSGEEPTHNVMHHSIRRAYLSAGESSRVFMQTGRGPQFYDIGQEPQGFEPSYNGKPIVTDKDVQLGRWIAINNNHLTHFILFEGEWAEETGSMMTRIPGQDAYEMIYRVAENYGTDKCNAHGKLTGLSTTNAIARHII